MDLETEFTDGTFVVTTNAYPARHAASPPTISSRYFEADTALSTLLREHAAHVEDHLATRHTSCVTVNSLEELLESKERLRLLKAEFELGRGHRVSREELRGHASYAVVPGADRVAEDIADAMLEDERKR